MSPTNDERNSQPICTNLVSYESPGEDKEGDMARFSSSAVGLALWTKTSISQSESLKNGQFRRIFVISPLFFSIFYKNAAQPLGFV